MINQENVNGQSTDREKLNIQNTWNLEDIYASDEAWQQAKEKIKPDIDKFESFKGSLGSSSKALLEYLEFSSQFGKEYNRIYSYASMKSDQDVRNSK